MLPNTGKLIPRYADIARASANDIGAIDRAINETITPITTAGKLTSETAQLLKDSAGRTYKALSDCGQSCVKQVDELIEETKIAKGINGVAALKDIEKAIADKTYDKYNIADIDRIVDYYQSAQCILSRTLTGQTLGALARPSNDPRGIKCPTVTLKDVNSRIIQVNADLDITHLNGGTDPTKAARAAAQQAATKEPGAIDQAGHILGYVLGGGGGLKADNIVAMLNKMNGGALSRFEKDLAEKVRNTATTGEKISVEIKLTYGEPKYPDRPSKISYTVNTTQPNNVVKSATTDFDNPIN